MLDFLKQREIEKQKIKTAYSCAHTETRLTMYVCSNGSIQYVMQCTKCWGRVGGPIKHSKLTRHQRKNAPLFNSTGRTVRRDEISHQFALNRERFNSSAWWRAYNGYLESDEWERKRKCILDRDKHTCTIRREWCTRRATEVHHLTYANVGNERLEDLTSICHNCHEVITEESRRGWRVM